MLYSWPCPQALLVLAEVVQYFFRVLCGAWSLHIPEIFFHEKADYSHVEDEERQMGVVSTPAAWHFSL